MQRPAALRRCSKVHQSTRTVQFADGDVAMKTYAFDFFAKNGIRIKAFNTRRDAVNAGNGYVLASNEEELAASNVKISQLVELYNALTPEHPIQTFRDRTTGIRRIIALAEAKAVVVEATASEESEMAKTAKKTKAPKEKKEGSGRKGRVSAHAGKRIFVAEGIEENPRREGGHGYNAMALVMSAGKRGILYEDYIEKGGRPQDLNWDLEKGHVVVE